MSRWLIEVLFNGVWLEGTVVDAETPAGAEAAGRAYYKGKEVRATPGDRVVLCCGRGGCCGGGEGGGACPTN